MELIADNSGTSVGWLWAFPFALLLSHEEGMLSITIFVKERTKNQEKWKQRVPMSLFFVTWTAQAYSTFKIRFLLLQTCHM